MVMPRRGATPHNGHTMRSGIDLFTPEEIHDASELGGVELLARALSIMEAGRPAWHNDGACRGSTLDFTNSKSKSNVAACIQVCGLCPVRADCLDWALGEVDDRIAILGGQDPPARARLARDRQARAIEPDDELADEQEITDVEE